MNSRGAAVASLIFLLSISSALACSASNEEGMTCSISCQVGQAEICIPAVGAGSPQCMCSGTPSESVLALRILRTQRPHEISAQFTSDTAAAPLTVTDAHLAVADALTKYGPVAVTRYHTEQRPGPQYCRFTHNSSADNPEVCFPTKVNVEIPVTTSEILQATNLAIVSRTELTFGEARFQDFPDQLVAHYITIQNCSNPPVPFTPPSPSSSNLSVTVGRSSSMAFSHSFTHGGSVSVGANVGLSDSVKLSATVTVSESETTGSTKTDVISDTITASGNASFSEPYMMKSLVGITSYKIGVFIPFQFTATIDGDLSINDKKLSRLSQILDAGKRTFVVSGVLVSNNASDGKITYYNPQPVTDEDCKIPGTVHSVGAQLAGWMIDSKPQSQ